MGCRRSLIRVLHPAVARARAFLGPFVAVSAVSPAVSAVGPLATGPVAVETFRTEHDSGDPMSGQSSGGGLMSSAGLVRYFDAEDRNAIRIDPKTVVAFGVVFGVFVQVLNIV